MSGLDRDTLARAVYLVDGSLTSTGTPRVSTAPATYQLAGTRGTPAAPGAPLASLAAGATTTPVTIPAGQSASYAWSATFGGTTPSLVLEALGADDTTYYTVATLTASGSLGVVVFTGDGGAIVRLRNAGTNAITNLSSRLSN